MRDMARLRLVEKASRRRHAYDASELCFRHIYQGQRSLSKIRFDIVELASISARVCDS